MKSKIALGFVMFISELVLANAAPEKLVGKFSVRVPYGASTVYYDLAKPMVLNPLRILYTVQPGCPLIPNTGLYVRYEGSSSWSTTRYGTGGYYSHGNGKVASLQFRLEQLGYQYENCEINMFEKAEEPESEVYAGVFGYFGGFARDQIVEFSESVRTKKFRLDVPDFCKNIEVMDVRLKMSPEKDIVLKKNLSDPLVFELAESRDIEKIFVTVNGPKEACDIPVYAYQKAQ